MNKPKITRYRSQKIAVEGERSHFHNRMEPNQASNWWQIHLATSISELTRFSVPLHLRPLNSTENRRFGALRSASP